MFNIVTKIRDKDLHKYGVILDLNNKKIIKNTFNNKKTYPEILQYFTDNYSDRFASMLSEYIQDVKDIISTTASSPDEK